MKSLFVSALLLHVGLSSIAHALDFQSAYELMLTNNGEYQAAVYTYKASKYDAKSAVSSYLPSVNLSGNYGRTEESIETFDQSFDNDGNADVSANSGSPSLSGINFEGASVPQQGTYDSGSASLDITQPIFDAARLSGIGRAKSQSKEANFEQLELRENLVLRLLQTYTSLLNANDEYAILTKELADLNQHRKLTQRRHDQGLGTLTDLHESESRYELVKAEQLGAQFDKERFLRELEVLVGQPVEGIEFVVKGFRPVLDVTLEGADIDSATDSEVLLAEQRVKTANYELKRQKSAFVPTLNLRAQSTYNTSGFSNVSNDQDRQTNRVFLELQIPLFAGFGNVNNVKSAHYRLRAERAALLDIKRSFDAEIKSNRKNYQVSYTRLKAFERAYLASNKALNLREKAFLEGLSSNLDLLDSVRSAYRAERSWRDALYAFINSKVALIASLREVTANDVSSLNEFFTAQPIKDQPENESGLKKTSIDNFKEKQFQQKQAKLLVGLELARSWAKAWSEKDAEKYLSFYSADFNSNQQNASFSEWAKSRRQNLSQKSFIRIELENLVVEEKEGYLVVSFKQEYESDSWKENNQKQLTFEKHGNDWRNAKIINELVL